MNLKREELSDWAQKAKDQNKKIVSTNGCFDLLHIGHIEYLADSKKCGDLLLVGINSDRSVEKLKGPNHPLQCQEDRATILLALKSVDAVHIFDEDTPVEFLKELKPDLHTKGGDYNKEDLPEYHALKKWNADVEIIKFRSGRSSSAIVKKILLANKD